jgi:hypothetical protein
MIGRVRMCSFVLISLLILGAAASAQGTAQLDGRVTDESGGVLPGVTVTATQTDTAFTRTTVTDETGAWLMPNLPIGPYRLEISLQGFRTYVQTGIVLQVSATPTINTTLAVGNLEETVSVEAAAPLVDVRSAGISEVVEQERIVELPLQGRQVTDLITLAGAAVNTGRVTQLGIAQSVAISVAGGLRSGVGYTLDGAMHNNTYDNSNLPFPFPDALQEFRVATSGLSADNGMHSSASVNAVVKSGTNSLHGNAFEFLRDRRFNAKSPFAPVGPDGTRLDDGLNRNQFGGTLGGPIVRDRLFFFGAYQRTRTIETPPDNLAFVPTAAMLAGDFTTAASPLCNGGRQVTLTAPFAGNRLDPARFSPAAVKIANHELFPKSTHPCGEIRFKRPGNTNDEQYVGRVDYQWSANHSIFGRYMDTFERVPGSLAETRNVLTITGTPNISKRATATAFGDTRVFGSNTVNAFRATWVATSTKSNQPPETFFDTTSLGIPVHTYIPGLMAMAVTNAFSFGGGPSVGAISDNTAYQAQNDFSQVIGRHQMSAGVNVAFSKLDQMNAALSVGDFIFNGRATGLGLADFLTGQVSQFRHGAPGLLINDQWYLGLYGQDTWRTTDRITLNLGLRWEPYFGTNFKDATISNFVRENFDRGIKSTVYVNAPAGLIYPGDPGFPDGTSGLKKQWLNLSPRVGAAWDVNGDGRLAVRASYAINYDYPGAVFQNTAVQAAPFNNRIDLIGNLPFDDPYRVIPGGQTHPVTGAPPRDVTFPGLGSYAVIDPDINSMRVQSWNVTVEQQLGTAWQVSASYLGNYMDRLWGPVQINPGVYLGLGPCTLAGVNYPVCSTTANVEARRVFSLQNPVEGRLMSNVSRYDDVGEQTYNGLKLSFRRRAADGVSLAGNYTVSKCMTDTQWTGSFIQFSAGYTDPSNPAYDRGNCSQNQRQIANLTVGYLTPELGHAVLSALASDWRVSGIVNARTGSWLTVTTGRDPAFSGIPGQRVDQVNDDPYSSEKTLASYLNPAAFAYPAPGMLGNEPNRGIEGPGYWTVDMSLARLLPFGSTRTLELRVEAFNLLNNFNWGNPATNLDAGTFGRITSQAGSPRIMQFAVKYGF